MFLKVMSTVGVLCSTSILPIFNNLREVLEYVSANYRVSNKCVICLVKQIYDDNLPNLFRYIISDSGLCGYWAYNYYHLYKSLGFNVDLYVLVDNKPIHYFIRVGVSNSSYIDIDREHCEDVINGCSNLIQVWSKSYSVRHASKLVVSKIVPSARWVSNYEKVSKLVLPSDLSLELSLYTNAILTDIHSYSPRKFTDLSTYDFSMLARRNNR